VAPTALKKLFMAPAAAIWLSFMLPELSTTKITSMASTARSASNDAVEGVLGAASGRRVGLG
jgi:hypothetical protein